MTTTSFRFRTPDISFCLISTLLLYCANAADNDDAEQQSPTSAPPILANATDVRNLLATPLIMYKNNNNPVIQLDGFEMCESNDCYQICGSREVHKSFCEPKNPKLCMCSTENFMSSNVEGVIVPVNRENPVERNCSVACNIRNSYARIWHRSDNSKTCTCLLNQITVTGITLCDEFAMKDLCKSICQSDSAVCAFNGVCLCRRTWDSVFRRTLANVRNELDTDNKECSRRCREYHSEFVARIYDTKLDTPGSKSYEFREKYCICGEEIEPEDTSMREKLHGQGFQECTGLKCKMRCGMNMDAQCEPRFRRACLCPRNAVFIGKFLWARLPGRKETICVETCIRAGLAPRVIEWNPFYEPSADRTLPVYRTSRFPYLYDGKFCHCINLKNEPDINQFRPCTNELCQWICGHSGATCDQKTRRICLCNTHQMLAGLGRRPDPGETNCNIFCRRNLNEARVLEVVWDIPAPHWSVSRAKFCGCIRPVSPSGLTHCEGMTGRDICPRLCNNPDAYCTQDKVCECFTQPSLQKNPLIRVPNGKEAVECGEVCRSWTWPLAQDVDHQPYIYDESWKECVLNDTCPAIDTTPWTLTQPGALAVSVDALEERPDSPKKFCLCVKSDLVQNKPGIRMPFTLEPHRLSKSVPCIFNYTCMAVSETLHIVA